MAITKIEHEEVKFSNIQGSPNTLIYEKICSQYPKVHIGWSSPCDSSWFEILWL